MSEIKNIKLKNSIYYDEPIFKFLNPDDNNKLSLMKGVDLQELIFLLDEYYLTLRSRLDFDTNITFGLELEFENAMKERIEMRLQQLFPNKLWLFKEDRSLNNGAEINSPVLRDSENAWKELEQVCKLVSMDASIGSKSGGHIHIGTQVLGNKPKSWLNFIKLWSVYENVIYRFVYGEFLTGRPSMIKYAPPISKVLYQHYHYFNSKTFEIDDLLRDIYKGKYTAVNLAHVKKYDSYQIDNTIEFRSPNGTLEPVIWQNNVNLFVKLLLYCKNIKFDDDVVEKRHQLNLDKYTTLEFYNEIYLEQALELCDMIFTNNVDKVYFLRQYLKSFEIGTKELEKAKIFVKK